MFIVIEGIDGAGCETQAKLVYKKLTDNKKKNSVFFVKYPHYDNPVGRMIKDFLYQNKNLSPSEQFLLYCLQFIHDGPRIKKYLSKKSSADKITPIVVADRYFTSTLCYQTLEGITEKIALRFARDFGIIKPDLVFFLDVKPETAIKWKYGEGKELNFREKDLQFMKKTYHKYQYLVKKQIWTKWIKINGERPKAIITEEIINIINNKII